MVSHSGDERILAFVGRGDIVGELSIIDGLPRSASVVAVRDATLSCLSRTAFETFAKKHPELYKSLVELLAKRLRGTDTVVAAGSFLSLKGRVARTMLELAEHFGQEVGSGRIVIRQKISAERPRGHGRRCARERDQDPQRLAARKAGDSPVRLLLP